MRAAWTKPQRLEVGTDPWKAALVVQNVNNTVGLLGNEIDARLVVGVVDVLPAYLLPHVLLLLELEDVLVEVELKRLVGVVYAQLLEAVRRKVLSSTSKVDQKSACTK